MDITERVRKLHEIMCQNKVDVYIVPTADFHQSEYVGEYFKIREFLTGFTGSAGTAVFTANEAYLWTDGRYFIQAAKELEGTPVRLMKMGEPGVPDIEHFLNDSLPERGVIAFDGRCVSLGDGKLYEQIAAKKQGSVFCERDLAADIWEDRPALSEEPAWELALQYAGEDRGSKLERIRGFMREVGADCHILTTLDDICWTLNIRGNDIEFFPLVLSYAVIGMDRMDLYADASKFSDELRQKLEGDGVVFHPYNDIYEDVKKLDEGATVLIDPARLNYALWKNIPGKMGKVEMCNPEILFKAVKNPTEIDNIRKAQLKDSVAHVKFMKWVKENYDKEVITELSASRKLDELRAQQGNFIRPSFEPIVSFGEHGAIVHYTSSPETDVRLEGGSFLLTDTGAGFYEGSTDITRTYALGDVTDKMKEHFTLTAISNLQLASAKFLHGATGMTLDMLARKPFWDRNLNFNHGTGHGVGYLLNIHEPPTGFRWQFRAGEIQPFEDGMVVTDEPGIYLEGEYGIRLENELLTRKGLRNEYGQFMYFETITFVPMDLDAILPGMMTEEERRLLNNYNSAVYEKVSPFLDEEERAWLENYTRAV